MREEDKILQTIQFFIETILIDNNISKALAVVADDVLGVGINEQGTVSNKQELEGLLNSQKKVPFPYRISYPKTDVRYHPPAFATANVVFQIHYNKNGTTITNAFIQTAAAKKDCGEWKLCLLQAVPVKLTEDCIENYPLRFAENTLEELKKELQNDIYNLLDHNISIGLLGSYLDAMDMPPYFINNSLLTLLGGYTKEEFFSLIANNSFAIIHPEDRLRVIGEIFDALAQENHFRCRFRIVRKDGEIRWVAEYGKKNYRNGHEALLAAFVDITDIIQLQTDAQEKNNLICSDLRYAKKLQINLLPPRQFFEQAFSDFSVFWSPKEIVGGDFYWLKSFPSGTILCICDCTGHGTPGAMLTMLVSTALDSIVNEQNCHDPAQIMFQLDQHSAAILNARVQTADETSIQIHDGCDLVILFIAKDRSVSFSASSMPVFTCNGKETKRYRGRYLRIGEGRLNSRDDIEITHIPADENTAYYIASDGLFDQIGGLAGRPFGYQNFQELILRHHDEKQETITQKIWEAFEIHRGNQPRRDDVEFISFRP